MNTAEIANLKLINGVGDGQGTACVMSLASVLANEPFSDAPTCVCPIVRRLCIRLNDGAWWEGDAERTRKLWPLARRVLGSKSTREVEAKRVRLCVLAAAKIYAPAALRARGMEADALKLEALSDDASYEDIRVAARAARASAAADASARAAYSADHAVHAVRAAYSADHAADADHASAASAHAAAEAAEAAVHAADHAVHAVRAAYSADHAADADHASAASAHAAAEAAEAAVHAADHADHAADANAADAKRPMRRALKDLILRCLEVAP